MTASLDGQNSIYRVMPCVIRMSFQTIAELIGRLSKSSWSNCKRGWINPWRQIWSSVDNASDLALSDRFLPESRDNLIGFDLFSKGKWASLFLASNSNPLFFSCKSLSSDAKFGSQIKQSAKSIDWKYFLSHSGFFKNQFLKKSSAHVFVRKQFIYNTQV